MSHASKIEKAEGQLDCREGAKSLHNKVSNTLLLCFWLHCWRAKTDYAASQAVALAPTHQSGMEKLCWVLAVSLL